MDRMEPKLQAIVDSATPERLEALLLHDLLLQSLRVEAAPGIDVTNWGPNSGITRPERDRKRRAMLDELRQAETRGEVAPSEAAELRRLIMRILR